MKYYDVAISLGQCCITSTALRRNNLQAESMIFDWSAGILFDVCGLGGLEGKVNLICNDFENFFNLEDLENRGNNQENDTHNLWIVNKRTGLQYKHDFPAWQPVDEAFPFVKERLNRRVKRLYDVINSSEKILFCFFARDVGFTDELLIEQQVKLSRKFPNKTIDFLYILQNPSYEVDKYEIFDLNDNVKKIEMNFIHPTDPVYPESWNGNTEVYYPLLRKLVCTKATLPQLNDTVIKLTKKVDMISSSILNFKDESIQNFDKLSQIEILENNLKGISAELLDYKIKYSEITSEIIKNDKLSSSINTLKQQNDRLSEEMKIYKSKLEQLEQKPSSLEQIFSVKNQNDHKVIRILGIKIKFKYKK